MKAALEGLPGVMSADVDLERGMATVKSDCPIEAELAIEAVRGKVILSWGRSLLARTPFLGKRGQ